MADDSKEKSSAAHDISSAKASIFDTLNKIRKWREEQRADCQRRQLLDSEKSLQLTRETQKQFEKLLENGTEYQHSEPEDKPEEKVPELASLSSISLPNDFDNCDTLHESSITGHLQRCFDDSSQSNISVSGNKVQHAPEKVPVFSELRNPQFSEVNLEEKNSQTAKTGTSKPKRPFLRKGSGLLRYMPKAANKDRIGSNKESLKVTKPQLPQKTLTLKPALRKTDVPSEQVKHIRFDITDSNDDIEVLTNDYSPSDQFPSPKANENASDANIREENRVEHLNPAVHTSPENDKLDTSNSGSESLSLCKESKELEEFEMLENYAQNSSFNSDSSLVQRILKGEPAKPPTINENHSRPTSQNVNSTKKALTRSPENFNFPEKISLNKCNEEIQARKQMLQKVISGINPRIESLQKEISGDEKQTLDDDGDDNDGGDRCSTPVNLRDRIPSSEWESNIGSSVFETSPEAQIDRDINEAVNSVECSCCNVKNSHENFYPVQDHAHICNDEEGCACNYTDEDYENEQDPTEKSKIRSKLLQLENEIKAYQRETETYARLNAKLASACKDRENVIKKLQKEREDFHKHKEAELAKLEAHIEEERRQIKRQKETFMRYQKLRKDNPTKKERDELSALRLEMEKLHEELRRQKIKYNNDCRRLKNRAEIAEKDRDIFKMESIRLEEQCQDLLATLKARMKKSIKSLDNACAQHVDKNENIKSLPEKKDAETQTETKNLNFNDSQDSNLQLQNSANRNKSTKSHFSIVSEFEKENVDVNGQDANVCARDSSKDSDFHAEGNDMMGKFGDNRKENAEKAFLDVQLSVISVSEQGEFREINHGDTIERIYPSGEKETFYNNGTRKVVSADGKSRKFFFYNGDTKEICHDQTIYTYVNGIIETTFSDGLKITKFPKLHGTAGVSNTWPVGHMGLTSALFATCHDKYGQIQRHYPNERKEVRFPDGSVQTILEDGSEEIRSPDGNLVRKCSDGTKIIERKNGLREIITDSYKRLEFPDYTVRIFYNSGRQETRYHDGRIKIKDKEGKVIFDTKYV